MYVPTNRKFGGTGKDSGAVRWIIGQWEHMHRSQQGQWRTVVQWAGGSAPSAAFGGVISVYAPPNQTTFKWVNPSSDLFLGLSPA